MSEAANGISERDGLRIGKAALFLLVWFSCAWFGSWEGNPGNAVRLFAAVSLVEDGDATIDEFAPLTIDKARFGDHFYLDKAPGMTLMALPAVAVMNAVTGDRSADFAKVEGDPALSRFLLSRQWLAAATGPAVLTAVAAVLLFDLALGLSASLAGAVAASLGYALGSPIWGWSTTLFGHAAVAALYVVAIWAVWRGTADTRARPGLAFVAGAALGWAVVVEYQAILAGAVIAAWALTRVAARPERWRAIAAAIAGGAVALLPLLAYNFVAYGTVFRLGYQGVVGFEGMNQGLFGLTAPSAAVLGEITVGIRRGLFWVAPVLLVGLFGIVKLIERRETRAIGAMLAMATGVVLLVNAAYVYWDGGNSTGPRHAMPVAGLLALGIAPFWARLARSWQRWAVAVVLGGSMLLNLGIAAADIMAPPTYPYPLKTIVWDMRITGGQLRTVPSSFGGWSVWAGLAFYLAVALPLLAWLARRAARA